MSLDRGWMYRRYQNGSLTTEFYEGLESFLDFAVSKPTLIEGEKIRCPCLKCQHRHFHPPSTVHVHLAKKGFVPNYQTWVSHGEERVSKLTHLNSESESSSSRFEEMIYDAGNSFHFRMNQPQEEAPHPEAQKLYDLLSAADKPLWPGCKSHSQLSLVARLMNLKLEDGLSERTFDKIVDLIREVVPENNCVIQNFYAAKKMLCGMGLPVEIIDCCRNNCMIFWKADANLTSCKLCGASRYKDSTTVGRKRVKSQVPCSKMYYFPLTPRLQRLYASNATAAEMRWHADTVENGAMGHPADSPAWKHMNSKYPEFASEVRNVRLGLSADGFQPFGQTGKQYASWPVIITPYNLPPWLCMKEQYMFLTVVFPGPKSPKEMIDVFLQPLIEELTNLWNVRAPTYDVSLKQNFQMRAALLWTIIDFPVYSMLSGWSTAGRLTCPYCMTNTDAFRFPFSGRHSWFDCHHKFLSSIHHWRWNRTHFKKNTIITTHPPEYKSGHEILAEITRLGLKKVTEMDIEDTRNRINKKGRRSKSGWKKRSIFWDLPYWPRC